MPINLFFSNHTEKLLEKLAENLKREWTDPFISPILVIPNKNMAKWIKLRLADRNKIIANLNCQYLEKVLIDNINLLYVAFTRAVDNLYIIAQRKNKNENYLRLNELAVPMMKEDKNMEGHFILELKILTQSLLIKNHTI